MVMLVITGSIFSQQKAPFRGQRKQKQKGQASARIFSKMPFSGALTFGFKRGRRWEIHEGNCGGKSWKITLFNGVFCIAM